MNTLVHTNFFIYESGMKGGLHYMDMLAGCSVNLFTLHNFVEKHR